MNQLQLIWNQCLQFMRDNLNAAEEQTDVQKLEKSFDLLFDKVFPISLENGNLTLAVPSDFYKEYIEEHYINLLSAALKKNIGKGVKLWYSITDATPNPAFIQQKNKEMLPESSSELQHDLLKSAGQPSTSEKHLEKKIEEPAAPMMSSNPIQRKISNKPASYLIPSMSFETYVEGGSNKMASTVGKSIAVRPGTTAFNPLFLHGDVGVGKTHLAHAIGLEIVKNFPEKKVLYISSETFIQDFIASAIKKNRADFTNYYLNFDCLIIDDIQFLSSKSSTQDSFFHIFDHFHQNGKQIILTSDKAPADIRDIQERIVSRFKWGISTELSCPDFETRRKIIVDKLQRDGIVVVDEILDFLASEVDTNIRELVGVINSVIVYSTVYKTELSLELLKSTIRKITQKKEKTITIPFIQETVCEYFNIRQSELLSTSRKRDIAFPRQLAMYFSKELTPATYKRIGTETGGRDHTTVIYACDTVRNLAQMDKEVKRAIKDLSEKFKN